MTITTTATATNNTAPNVKTLKQQAEQGDAGTQFNLGRMCALGQGVTQDNKKAVAWLTQSAEQGDAGTQYYLGRMYEQGQGVKKDLKKVFIF